MRGVSLVKIPPDVERIRDCGVSGGVMYDWEGVTLRSVGVVRGGCGADRLAVRRNVYEVDPDGTIGNTFHVECQSVRQRKDVT